MPKQATDPSRQRSARGNAMLLRLDCETTLAPAAQHNTSMDFLQAPVNTIMSMPLPGTAYPSYPDPAFIAEQLDEALAKATKTLPQQQHPSYETHRRVLQVLARCAARARRLDAFASEETSPQGGTAE